MNLLLIGKMIFFIPCLVEVLTRITFINLSSLKEYIIKNYCVKTQTQVRKMVFDTFPYNSLEYFEDYSFIIL